MIVFLALVYGFNFRDKHGYRLKLEGEDERYVAKIGGTIRAILASDIDKIPGVEYVIELVHLGGDEYQLKFCGGFLSAMNKSDGVVARVNAEEDFSQFRLRKKGMALQLFNGRKNQCLGQISTYDTELKGYRINSVDCSGKHPTSMVLLDVGPIYYHCKDQAEAFCKSVNEAEDALKSNIAIDSVNDFNFGYNSEQNVSGSFNSSKNVNNGVNIDPYANEGGTYSYKTLVDFGSFTPQNDKSNGKGVGYHQPNYNSSITLLDNPYTKIISTTDGKYVKYSRGYSSQGKKPYTRSIGNRDKQAQSYYY